MTNLINKIVKLSISILVVLGFALIFKNKMVKQTESAESAEPASSKSLVLKKFLLKFQKPERIEIYGLSERFAKDITELKKLKVAQDKASDFYVTIKLFSDETDITAPLVAQIQFVDLKSGNLRKEESINLE